MCHIRDIQTTEISVLDHYMLGTTLEIHHCHHMNVQGRKQILYNSYQLNYETN